MPEIYNGHNFGHVVDQDDVQACAELYGEPKRLYSDEMRELAKLLLPNHEVPTCAEEAFQLYEDLLDQINRYS